MKKANAKQKVQKKATSNEAKFIIMISITITMFFAKVLQIFFVCGHSLSWKSVEDVNKVPLIRGNVIMWTPQLTNLMTL